MKSKQHPPRSAGQYNRANLSAQQRAPLTQYDIRSRLFEGFRRGWRGGKASEISASSVRRAAPEPQRHARTELECRGGGHI